MIRQSKWAAMAVAALALFSLTRSVSAADNAIVQTGSCVSCQPVCCDDCHKVCRPTVETRDVAKRCYGSRCEDFCLPKCSSLLGRCFGGSCCGDGCGSAACHECERPRTRKYLVLYIRHHEECVPKCVVDSQVCPAPCVMPAPCGVPVQMPASAGMPSTPIRMGIINVQPAPAVQLTPMYPTDPIPLNLGVRPPVGSYR